MTTQATVLTNDEFVKQFESQTLNPVYFDHQGHIRIACIYLNMYDFDTANNKTCCGIKAYAESLGATDKFNLTITDAIVKIMAKRMKSASDNTWQVFIKNNPDIVHDTLGLLSQYFSKELMFSEQARKFLVKPDLKAL